MSKCNRVDLKASMEQLEKENKFVALLYVPDAGVIMLFKEAGQEDASCPR